MSSTVGQSQHVHEAAQSSLHHQTTIPNTSVSAPMSPAEFSPMSMLPGAVNAQQLYQYHQQIQTHMKQMYQQTLGQRRSIRMDPTACPVCLVPRADTRLQPCLHTFHSRCISRWLESSDQCPLCRIKIKRLTHMAPEKKCMADLPSALQPASEASLNAVKSTELRRGKWTAEEEAYAGRLISEFKAGLLPLTDGTTLRTFLSRLLNCDPMRISKKFVGSQCIGKQVFKRASVDTKLQTPTEIEQKRVELAKLEQRFLNRINQQKQKRERKGERLSGSSGGPSNIHPMPLKMNALFENVKNPSDATSSSTTTSNTLSVSSGVPVVSAAPLNAESWAESSSDVPTSPSCIIDTLPRVPSIEALGTMGLPPLDTLDGIYSFSFPRIGSLENMMALGSMTRNASAESLNSLSFSRVTSLENLSSMSETNNPTAMSNSNVAISVEPPLAVKVSNPPKGGVPSGGLPRVPSLDKSLGKLAAEASECKSQISRPSSLSNLATVAETFDTSNGKVNIVPSSDLCLGGLYKAPSGDKLSGMNRVSSIDDILALISHSESTPTDTPSTTMLMQNTKRSTTGYDSNASTKKQKVQ